MKFSLTIAILVTLISACSLSAQQVQPGQSPSKIPQTNQNSVIGSTFSKEQFFEKCLAITNQEEVTIARFAKEKSTSKDVQALAAILEKAHQDCLDELAKLATRSAASRKASTPGSPVAPHDVSPTDFLQMHQEISEQFLKDSKDLLGKKEGREFDVCFVGMQVAKHNAMHSSLTVLQRHTTGELQKFITASLAKNDEHSKTATSLMEKLSDKVQ